MITPSTMSEAKETFLYFAYGSNLHTKRIHHQNPSAVFKDVAKLRGYRLDFRISSQVKDSKYLQNEHDQSNAFRGGEDVQPQ